MRPATYSHRTINAYIKYADKCISNWSKMPKISGLLRTIINGYCLKNGNEENIEKINVLDLGCGLGYDSLIFADIGKCNVYSIDAVPQFLDFFKTNIEYVESQNNKHLDIKIVECDFNEILNCEAVTEHKYDILWNNASLMHLSKTEFDKFLYDIHDVCTGNTIFGSLFYKGDGSKERYTDLTFVPDRYLSEYSKNELSRIYTKNGWKILLMSPAADYNRKGDWIQILAQQTSDRHTQYNRSNSYGHSNNNNHDIDDIDITEGNPVYDIRVVAFKRQIKQLKEKIELQTELNRKLETDKNELESQLASYKKRCVDLQKNLDDKDAHLNEVVASLTIQHSKTIPVNKKKKERSGWFGFGTPKAPKSSLNTFLTPNMKHNHTPSPIQSPSIDLNQEIDYDHDQHVLPCMTAPIGPIGSSLPITGSTRRRRHGSVHIIDGSGDFGVYVGAGTSSLIGMDRNEMEFKIKNSSRDKLRNYIRDVYAKYNVLDGEKKQLFHDLVKATHNQGWTEKQALTADKEAKTAISKEKNAKNHIKSLEKSLKKERKKIEKYRITFEDFKASAIKKRKDMLLNDKKLQDIICMKDEFIQRACYKLILYKDRLAQFEVPVFQEYLILISPAVQELMRCDSEGMNGPGCSGQNLRALHEEMIEKQTAGGPGPGFVNEEVNSAGGTVTSIASVTSVNSSAGRHKSSSRKSSAASASASVSHNDEIGDINDIDHVASNNSKQHKSNKKKKRRHKKKLRVKSYDDRFDADDLKEESINIAITARAKTKKRKKSKGNLSRKMDKKKKRKEKEKKKAAERKEKLKEKIEKAQEDYLELDLDDMVSSSSSSSSSSEEDFLLLSDSGGDIHNETILEYALDAKGKYIEKDGISNNLANYVELKLVKYPGTGELYVVIIKFDEKKDAMEVFRCDFAKCFNIEKNQIEEDFSIMFEHITLVFRGDGYEKVMEILINLRLFFEQHCSNIQPKLPPPPEQTVTEQMNMFFGGF